MRKISRLLLQRWKLNTSMTGYLLVCLLSVLMSGPIRAEQPLTYHVTFRAEFSQADSLAKVSIHIEQPRRIARRLSFNAPPDRYRLSPAEEGSERAIRMGDQVIWQPGVNGDVLNMLVRIDQTKGDAHDALAQPVGFIMRLGDLFPSASVRTLKGAYSISHVELTGPAGWSFESRYGALNSALTLPRQGRNFTRPTGWLIGGELATRRAIIADTRVAVSSLTGEGARHLDLLAFLRWTLPQVNEVTGGIPERLLVVVGGNGMWRGALSGPDSIYLHKDRPMISGNGTSTLLHEMMHVRGLHSAEDADWIVEGLAEFYSLDLLHRSGAISARRLQRSFENLSEWADAQQGRLRNPSRGADTARATLLFRALDAEMNRAGHSLDAVTRALLHRSEISTATLQQEVTGLLGRSSQVLRQELSRYGAPVQAQTP